MEYNERFRLKQFRGICSGQGFLVLLYLGIMQLSVDGVMIVEAIISMIKQQDFSQTALYEALNASGQTGAAYIVMVVGVLIMMLLVKKPKFLFNTIWERGRPMVFKDFATLIILFMGVQGVSQVVLLGAESVLNSLGLTILETIGLVNGDNDEIMMFIYVAVGAPIVEELMFRGLVMRSLQPMGKRFAIVVSAVIFGLFHGNIIQAPFAILVGLVLGYVAMEYSIAWSILLHMFNNMIFADTLTRVIPGITGNAIMAIIDYGCLIAGIVILICRRKEIRYYARTNPNERFAKRALFSAPGMILFCIYTVYTIVRTALILITPLSGV